MALERRRPLTEQEQKPETTLDQLGLDSLDRMDVMLHVDAAQPLSMALHELTTNAAKYGALSSARGRLEVRWHVENGSVHLLWQETGGPLLDGPPDYQSFGTQLIESIFQGQLGGQIKRRWEQAGLICEVTFPAQLA